MEQHTNTAAIEISDTSIEFVVGYCINKMPVIVYRDARNLKEGAVVDGIIVRPDEVTEVVKEFLNLQDDSIRAKVGGMCSMLIPGIGYNLYENEPQTFISDFNSGVRTVDVSNLIGMVGSQKIPQEIKVVDIVPSFYRVDSGAITEDPPYGVSTHSLQAKMEVHTVDAKIYQGHRTSVEHSGFRVDVAAVNGYAAAYLISNHYAKQKLENYFYVDLGAKTTTVTFVIRKYVPFAIQTFNKRGGDDLTKAIAARFQINYHEAEQLKIKYGYNPKVRAFELPIYKGINMEGQEITLMQRELNKVIEEFFESLIKNIVNCMDVEIKKTTKVIQNFPIFVGGGASKLMGIEYLLEKLKPYCQSWHLFIPSVAGARDPGLIPLLGLIAINGKSQEHQDDSYRGMSTLTRQQ